MVSCEEMLGEKVQTAALVILQQYCRLLILAPNDIVRVR